MADMKQDRKNDYLHKDNNGQWHVEMPQVGNCTRFLALPVYSGGQISLPLMRKITEAIRSEVELHHLDLLKEYGTATDGEIAIVAPGPRVAGDKKGTGEINEFWKLREKSKRLITGVVAYSKHVMDSAREYALSAIDIEETDRPYRSKIQGGVLPPMPRGDVPLNIARNEFEGVSGVYFIHRDHQLVYVGQAINIGDRIKKHHVASPTDKICVVEVPLDHLRKAEDFYIWSLRPPINKEWKYSYENGELSGSPLARFVTEEQPEPTDRKSVQLAVPMPHKSNIASTNFSASVNALARSPEIKAKAEQLFWELASCLTKGSDDPEQEIEPLLELACEALQEESAGIRQSVNWARDGNTVPAEATGPKTKHQDD